jgi:AcrR family transcriptional regulator
MTGAQRREQLLDIGRRLFAKRGFEGTSIEEIAAQAGVSKPVVYEHFGGKEGLYAVVVDREMQTLLTMVTQMTVGENSREKYEDAAVALLRYIEDNADGFRILVRDSDAAGGTGTFGSLLADIASQVEYILADVFRARGYDPKYAPMYAQMLTGMVAFTGQWWLDARKPKVEEVAAHLVNLAWNGLAALDPKPKLPARDARRHRGTRGHGDGDAGGPRAADAQDAGSRTAGSRARTAGSNGPRDGGGPGLAGPRTHESSAPTAT